MCLLYCGEDDAIRLNTATVQLELGMLAEAEAHLLPALSSTAVTVQHSYLMARQQFLNGATRECLQTLLQLSSHTSALAPEDLKRQLLNFKQPIRYLAQECLRLEAQRHEAWLRDQAVIDGLLPVHRPRPASGAPVAEEEALCETYITEGRLPNTLGGQAPLVPPLEPSASAAPVTGDGDHSSRKARVLGHFTGWAPHNPSIGFVKHKDPLTGEWHKYQFHASRIECDKASLTKNGLVDFELYTSRDHKVFAQALRILPEDMRLKHINGRRAAQSAADKATKHTLAEQTPASAADKATKKTMLEQAPTLAEVFYGEIIEWTTPQWGKLRYTPDKRNPAGHNVYQPESPNAVLIDVHRNALRGDKSQFQPGAYVEFVYRQKVGKYAQRVLFLKPAVPPELKGLARLTAPASAASSPSNPNLPPVPAGLQIGVFQEWSTFSEVHGRIQFYRNPLAVPASSSGNTIADTNPELTVFHKKRLLCLESDLKPGTVVTFECFRSQGEDKSLYAQKVQLASPAQASIEAIQRLSRALVQSTQVQHAFFLGWVSPQWGRLQPFEVETDFTLVPPRKRIVFDPHSALDFYESCMDSLRSDFEEGAELEYRLFPLSGPYPQHVKVLPPQLGIMQKVAAQGR